MYDTSHMSIMDVSKSTVVNLSFLYTSVCRTG